MQHSTATTSTPLPPSTPLVGATGSGHGQHGQHGPSPEAMAAATEETRWDLELKLKELIECLLELSITVYDFQPESNSLVHQKIQELISQLSDVEGFKDKLDVLVPMEVLSFIEDGKNPDLFTKSFIECVAGENQFTNGKITAMKSFESSLAQNLESFFPEEMVEYQNTLNLLAAGMEPQSEPGIVSGSGSGSGPGLGLESGSGSGSELGIGSAGVADIGLVHVKEEPTPMETSITPANASTLSSASTSLLPS
ncbi:Mediator of RNA polymerase II transcription subunit 10 [Podila epigama]|nr:Mediator of RNA polymerase II transcription subunit 10 [Podila epigama]